MSKGDALTLCCYDIGRHLGDREEAVFTCVCLCVCLAYVTRCTCVCVCVCVRLWLRERIGSWFVFAGEGGAEAEAAESEDGGSVRSAAESIYRKRRGGAEPEYARAV